jgi:hypothetical protein
VIASILVLLSHAGSASATPSFEDAGGAFFPAVRYPVDANPFSVAEGDFNGDGKIDLAVGNWDGDNVSILLGTGGGVFASAVNYAVGDGAQTVAVADFNGDNKLDLAVANIWSHNVSVLLGTGTGTFAASVPYPAGVNPRTVSVADLNGDGKLDLAVANGSSNNVSVFLGNGAGGFGSATHFAVGGNPISVAIGKFNADASPDMAVANQGSNNVSILLGTGTGAFGAATHITVGAGPTSVAAGDFNANGQLDLAVTNVDGGNVSLLMGTGTGTFSAASPVAAGARPIFVAAGDLSGDGKPELAIANEGGDTVSILLGSSSGEFGSATHVPTTGEIARSLAIGDVNNDGRPDLAVVNAASGDVSVLLAEVLPVLDIKPLGNNDATSSYALRKSTLWINRQLPGAWPFAHAGYADFNKDGRIDFVRTFSDNTNTRRAVQFMRNDGGGAFSDQTATMVSNAQPGVLVTRKILIGDYNNDGWPDVFVLGHGLDGITPAPGEYPQLFLSNGNGTLRYVPGLEPHPAFNHGGASGDIDNNGTVDILLPDARTADFPVPGPPRPYFLLNDGHGNLIRNFNRVPSEFVTNVNYAIELVDIDQDGYIDILTGGDELTGIGTIIYWGNASGYYRASNKLVLPGVSGWEIVWDFAADDLDGDGLRDVIVYRVPSDPGDNGRYFQILRQTDLRNFVDETSTRISMDTAEPALDFIRTQDLDGDGDLDLFIDDRDYVAKGDYAWINNGAGVFAPYTGAVTSLSPAPAISITDVAVAEGNSGTRLLTFTVGLSSISAAAVTYDVATLDNTATSGSDYMARSLSGQSIPAGQASQAFAVTINGDVAAEAAETFFVTLDNVAGATVANGTAAGTITNDEAPSTLSINDVSLVEGASGTKVMNFTVSLSAPAAGPVTYDIGTTPGSATPGVDFVASNLTGQTIPAGTVLKAFSVTINSDTAIEGNETLFANVFNVSGATLVDGQGMGTIINDDGVYASIADVAITEGHSGTKVATFVVLLNKTSPSPVTYNIATSNGTATAGSDYVASALTGQSIPAGQQSKVFSVTLNGDTTLEPNETFNVTLSSLSGASAFDGQAVGTILNDEGPTLSIGDRGYFESDSGTSAMTFVVTLSQVSAVPVTFDIGTSNYTAVNPSDYVGRSLTGQVMPAGTRTWTFVVTTKRDTVIEQNEEFYVTLSNTSVSATDGQAKGTLVNDDGPILSITDAAVTEGNAGTKTMTFTVNLSQASASPVTYSIATANQTAAAGSDYIAASAVGETIPAGMTSKTFSVSIKGETTVEANETFKVNVSNASVSMSDGQGIGTITNDD